MTGSCVDLRKYQDVSSVEDAFSKLVSGGKAGYKTVIERKKEPLKCQSCGTILEGNEKFCPECGTPVKKEEKKS
jgi:rRNA maturation endonuclease Nob1